jgi:serine/threonine protein kinase
MTPQEKEDSDRAIHSNLLRVQTKADVFKKYEVIEELVGSGSMGTVSKVRIRENKIGGSAFHAKPQSFFGKIKQRLTLKRDDHQGPSVISRDHIYALKSIQLDRVSPAFVDELENEISILRKMDHPNIVKAHEVFVCKNKQIYIVLELCDGGDLYARSPYTEKEAARIVTKLLSAISYLHENKIVHRDLKFENVMWEDHSATAEIKIIDFGLSKKFLGKPGYMTERVGTM